jgi:hypothetical protein
MAALNVGGLSAAVAPTLANNNAETNGAARISRLLANLMFGSLRLPRAGL